LPLKTGCWGEYLDLRKWENGEKLHNEELKICTLQESLGRWSRWDGLQARSSWGVQNKEINPKTWREKNIRETWTRTRRNI